MSVSAPRPRPAMRLRLGHRLLLAFLLVGLVPLGIGVWITVRSAEDALHERALQSLQATGRQRAARLESFIQNRIRDAALLSNEQGLIQALHELELELHRGGLEAPGYRAAERRVRPLLIRHREAHQAADLLLLAAAGDTLFSVTRGQDLGVRLTAQPYRATALADVFDRATTLLEVAVSDYGYYPATRELAFFVAAPVLRAEAVVGVVAMRFGEAEIRGLVDDYAGLGETGEIVLGQRAGDEALVVAPLRHDPQAAFERRVPKSPTSGSPLWDAARGQRGTGIVTDYRGQEVVATWRYIPEFGWGMVVKIDTAEAFAPARRLLRLSAWVGGLALILVLVCALLLSRRVANPIRRLSATALLIAEGDLSRRVDIASADELGQLGWSFDRMADEVHEARTVLEQKVETRTALLAARTAELERQTDRLVESERCLREQQQELQEANAELELAGRYKSEFLANMSHELRTPLNSLLILSRLLADNRSRNLGEGEVEWARTIHSSGSDLLALINDILDLAKVEAGRLNIAPEVVDIPMFADQVRRSFAHVADERGLGFRLVLDDGAPKQLYTDPRRLNQIVRNLLSNALKFTARGEVAIRLEGPGDTLRLVVTDTGPGIAPERQELVFEAFRQAEGSITRTHGGTGLGLTISRQLARLLGGDLTLRSVPGEPGSTFTLTVPAYPPGADVVAATPSPVPAARASAPAAPVAADARGAPILIVEDDPRFAAAMADLARERGFAAIVAHDGEEALRLAREARPLGILLDMHLPTMDGWQVMKELKRDPRTRHVPVHAISGDEAVMQAEAYGAVGWVLKPATREQLAEALEKVGAASLHPLRRLLVVEDDRVQQLHIQQLLAELDVEITVADCGERALELLEAERYDCVILDLMLPDVGGFDVLDRLAALPGTPPPVVVYTARDLTGDDEQRLQRVARAVVLKGGQGEDGLLRAIGVFLGSVQEGDGEPTPPVPSAGELVFDGQTVLLVDDDIRNVYAMRTVLEGHGLSVIVGRNGREAIERLQENVDIVDLVLMDIMMPVMDGYEATRRIRADPRFESLPILAVTAKAKPEDAEKCLELGANDHLPKPVEMDRLLSLLRVWLSGKEA